MGLLRAYWAALPPLALALMATVILLFLPGGPGHLQLGVNFRHKPVTTLLDPLRGPALQLAYSQL